MKNRLSLSFLFLAFFLFSCAGVDVERNETNVKAEKDAAAGKKVLTPDSEGLLDDLFDVCFVSPPHDIKTRVKIIKRYFFIFLLYF